MREFIIAILGLFLLLGCRKQEVPTESQNTQIKSKIDLLLNDWHKAAAEANFENYFGLMDSLSVFIGTDAAEVWSKEKFQEFSKPHFDKGAAWDFTAIDRNIYMSKTAEVVWFDELLTTWMGTCRGSGVLEISNGEWKLKHYVLSVAIPNDVIREVVKINAEADSLFLRTFNNMN